MHRFHYIDDSAVILQTSGVYKQVRVVRRDRDLYALSGGGFIRLYKNKSTSVPKVSWLDIEIPDYAFDQLLSDPFGKLSLPGNVEPAGGPVK